MMLGYVDSGLQEEFRERDAVEVTGSAQGHKGESGGCPESGSPLAHGPVEQDGEERDDEEYNRAGPVCDVS